MKNNYIVFAGNPSDLEIATHTLSITSALEFNVRPTKFYQKANKVAVEFSMVKDFEALFARFVEKIKFTEYQGKMPCIATLK